MPQETILSHSDFSSPFFLLSTHKILSIKRLCWGSLISFGQLLAWGSVWKIKMFMACFFSFTSQFYWAWIYIHKMYLFFKCVVYQKLCDQSHQGKEHLPRRDPVLTLQRPPAVIPLHLRHPLICFISLWLSFACLQCHIMDACRITLWLLSRSIISLRFTHVSRISSLFLFIAK